MPSNATGDGTVTIEYYATSTGVDVDVVVMIYDEATGSTVWYTIVDGVQGQWVTLQVTVPADVIASIAGGKYLFLVGMRASTFTLWWWDEASIYFDSVSFTVPTA